MNQDVVYTETETDERFVNEWIEYGFREMGRYLESHARFAAFCAKRDAKRKF